MPQSCINCDSKELYKNETRVPRGLRLGLFIGRIWTGVGLQTIVCAKCGLMQLYVAERERKQVMTSSKWEKL